MRYANNMVLYRLGHLRSAAELGRRNVLLIRAVMRSTTRLPDVTDQRAA